MILEILMPQCRTWFQKALNSQPLIHNSIAVTIQRSQKMQRNSWLRPRKTRGLTEVL